MAELILALDVRTRAEALELLGRLPEVGWVKVGSILMTAEGPALVRELVGRGLSVFLDLKWHDIPNTVAGAVSVAGELGVRMATLHVSGGEEMMRAAAAAAPRTLALVGVTVLTSHRVVSSTDDKDLKGSPGTRMWDSGIDSVEEQVAQRARLAVGAGLAGVVCSPLEVASVRAGIGPDGLIVVPGIRQSGDPADDQQRTATAGFAARAGATHLVVGRTVLQASNPTAAWSELLDQLPRP